MRTDFCERQTEKKVSRFLRFALQQDKRGRIDRDELAFNAKNVFIGSLELVSTKLWAGNLIIKNLKRKIL